MTTKVHSFLSVIERLREAISINSTPRGVKILDKEIATTLKINQASFSTMKTRKRLPYSKILHYCSQNQVSADWVFLEVGDPIQKKPTLSPAVSKKYLSMAKKYQKQLEKDKNDSRGYRYRIGVLFYLSGEINDATNHYKSLKRVYRNDIGEPISELFWALTLRECGHKDEARQRLYSAMISNMYMLPLIMSEPISHLNIEHSTSNSYREYLDMENEFIKHFPADALTWITETYYSSEARILREKYINRNARLAATRDFSARRNITLEYDNFIYDNRSTYRLL